MTTPERRRRGFTIVELLVTMTLVGILVNISIPIYRNVTIKADAAHVMADFTTIRLAALEHHARESAFPAPADWRVIPPELLDELPDGFDFGYGTADYRWRKWTLGGGSGPSVMVGLEVRSPDPVLLATIARQYEGQIVAGGNQITFVID
ncbi:MAG: prepilin-type N-terminal cleavage/methylation domain-containing protein [Gemmatimonadota bacterium]|nr:prepilin-type N-terminal cleavage/methylation domain-containing protein [Gemmatimonadota bacterium]